MRGRIGWLAPTVALAVVAAAAAGSVGLVAGRTSSALASPRVVQEAPAVRVDFTDDRTVDVTFGRVQPQPLTLGRGGMVTQTSCALDAELVSGREILRVDESVVLGLHQGIPIYRTLGPGDRGRDVSALQTELRRLGHDVAVDGEFGTGTRDALKKVERAAGVATPDGTLSLEDVVWLPSPVVVPASCEHAVGQRLEAGSPLATLPPTLRSIRPAALPATAVPGPRTVTLFGETLPWAQDGPITDEAFLAAVAAAPEYGATLEAKGDDRPTATLSLSQPVTAYKIPPGAIFALTGSLGCVEMGSQAVPVAIVGSGLGASLVTSATPLSSVDVGAAITSTSCAAS